MQRKRSAFDLVSVGRPVDENLFKNTKQLNHIAT